MHLFFVRARSFSAEVGRYVQDGLLTAVAPFARLSAASGVAEKVLRRARERAGLQPRRKARPNTFNNLWSGRRHGGAEAPPFRGPQMRFSAAPSVARPSRLRLSESANCRKPPPTMKRSPVNSAGYSWHVGCNQKYEQRISGDQSTFSFRSEPWLPS
jgi:hypothetical protein